MTYITTLAIADGVCMTQITAITAVQHHFDAIVGMLYYRVYAPITALTLLHSCNNNKIQNHTIIT